MSEIGNSFTYKGVDLAFSNVLVEESDIPWMSSPDTFAIGSGAGDISTDYTGIREKAIELHLAVWGNDRAAFRLNMETLMRELNPELGPGILTIDAIPERDFMAPLASGIVGVPAGVSAMKFPLTFLAEQHDYGTALKTGQGAFTGGDPTVTIVPSESDLSTAILQAVLYLQNTQGSDFTGALSLTNNTIAVETIEWDGTLEDDR